MPEPHAYHVNSTSAPHRMTRGRSRQSKLSAACLQELLPDHEVIGSAEPNAADVFGPANPPQVVSAIVSSSTSAPAVNVASPAVNVATPPKAQSKNSQRIYDGQPWEHATRRPLTQAQENQAAVLSKQQGRLIWIRIWNYDGTQKTVARPVIIPKNMQDLFDVYADARACEDLESRIAVIRSGLGRHYFPSPPPCVDTVPKTLAEAAAAVHALLQDETDAQPPAKRVRLSHDQTPSDDYNGTSSQPATNHHGPESPLDQQEQHSPPSPLPVEPPHSEQMPSAPFGTRGNFPFTYTLDMVAFCGEYRAMIPLTTSRREAFDAAVDKLFHKHEARPKYARSTVDDHVRYLARAPRMARRLSRLGRVPEGRWSLVRDHAKALITSGTFE
ncbi:hypothetical protein BDZ89DRAFT_1127578 [Hymenopellis radicata]|nr:hypothetical protein BDZ89DRAFT_1127578 [Hymenopellis radicata]